MKCVVCKTGQTRPGKTTITLERGNLTLVFKGVRAEVCENCGEAYVSVERSRELLASAEAAAQAGVEVEVREFVTAQVQ